jgi:hypothetical protein
LFQFRIKRLGTSDLVLYYNNNYKTNKTVISMIISQDKKKFVLLTNIQHFKHVHWKSLNGITLGMILSYCPNDNNIRINSIPMLLYKLYLFFPFPS